MTASKFTVVSCSVLIAVYVTVLLGDSMLLLILSRKSIEIASVLLILSELILIQFFNTKYSTI